MEKLWLLAPNICELEIMWQFCSMTYTTWILAFSRELCASCCFSFSTCFHSEEGQKVSQKLTRNLEGLFAFGIDSPACFCVLLMSLKKKFVLEKQIFGGGLSTRLNCYVSEFLHKCGVRGEEFRKRENCIVPVTVWFSDFLCYNGFSFLWSENRTHLTTLDK